MHARLIVLATLHVFWCSSAFAQINLPSLEDVGRTVLAPQLAPIDFAGRLLQGQSPQQAAQGALGPTGRVIQQGSTAYQQTMNIVYSYPRQVIEDNLGPDWRNAYDIAIANHMLQTQIGTTTGRFIGGCLLGQPCDPRAIVSVPVAAELKAAYQTYIWRGVPLHPNLIQVLQVVVPYNILASTRVVVDATPNFTFPGFINAGYELGGSGHAVTIGNLIIFSHQPNLSDPDDIVWFLHELWHHEQYRQRDPNDIVLAIERFAVDYVFDWARLEDEARQVGRRRHQELRWRGLAP